MSSFISKIAVNLLEHDLKQHKNKTKQKTITVKFKESMIKQLQIVKFGSEPVIWPELASTSSLLKRIRI